MTDLKMSRLFNLQNIDRLAGDQAQEQQTSDDFTKIISYIQKEIALKVAPTILHCSDNDLYRLSAMELADIFSKFPSSLTSWDISNNYLCQHNFRNTSDFLYQQENKLWAVCQFAINVQVLNIAGNQLYKLPVSSFQRLRGVFNKTTRLILGFSELKLLTIAQITALAEMFPNLTKVEFLGYASEPMDSSECRKNALVRHFESFISSKQISSPSTVTGLCGGGFS